MSTNDGPGNPGQPRPGSSRNGSRGQATTDGGHARGGDDGQPGPGPARTNSGSNRGARARGGPAGPRRRGASGRNAHGRGGPRPAGPGGQAPVTTRGGGYRPGAPPTGVKILCALLTIAGVLTVFAGQIVGILDQSLAMVFTLIGGGYVGVAYGLWNMRSWGWYAGAALLSFGGLVSLVNGLIPGALLDAGLLWYLWVKRAVFGVRL